MRLVIKVNSEEVLVTTEEKTETELGIETETENDTSVLEGTEDPEVSEEPTTEPLILVDDNLYLSEQAYLKTIDDCYAMLLSVRNVVLFWFLLWCILKVKSMIHTTILKYMRG